MQEGPYHKNQTAVQPGSHVAGAILLSDKLLGGAVASLQTRSGDSSPWQSANLRSLHRDGR